MHLQKKLHVGCDVARGIPFRSTNCSTPPTPLRFRITAKSIAACRMHLQKKLRGGLRGATRGWQLKIRSKLGLGAKHATPKNVRHSASATQNQLRLAECIAEKAAWWAAM
jgi:hypothetical protein